MRDGLAVGFFDGVHLGHRRLLERASAALTFSAHPVSVLSPADEPCPLMNRPSRIAAIRECGVGRVFEIDFTGEFAALSPEEFCRGHLLRILDGSGQRRILCGPNWRFGKGGAGDVETLRSLGFEVEVVPFATDDGLAVSSTRIRAALAAGDVASASRMLGYDYPLSGTVFRGKGEGRHLGFPTVNLRAEWPKTGDGRHLDLPFGVYDVRVLGLRAIANYGLAPTFASAAWTEPVMEIHFPIGEVPRLVDGDSASVGFARFMRPEMKFKSAGDLRRQIAEDVRTFCEEKS